MLKYLIDGRLIKKHSVNIYLLSFYGYKGSNHVCLVVTKFLSDAFEREFFQISYFFITKYDCEDEKT